MALIIDYESVGRKLCKIRGINPDARVNYLSAYGGYTDPGTCFAWENAAREARAIKECFDACVGSWIEDPNNPNLPAAKPTPVVKADVADFM